MTDLPKHHPKSGDRDFEPSSVGMLNIPTEKDRQLLIDLLEEKEEEMEKQPEYSTENDEFWEEFTLYEELLFQLKDLD